jgi:hypothetical protein
MSSVPKLLSQLVAPIPTVPLPLTCTVPVLVNVVGVIDSTPLGALIVPLFVNGPAPLIVIVLPDASALIVP